jgi:protein TonB
VSSFERIKSIDRSTLKIRETKYAEEETNHKETKQTPVLPKVETSAVIEKVVADKEVQESLNIDEILSKIADDNSEVKTAAISSDYEAEVISLKKKLRRNILVSAAMFIILITSGAFIYINMQSVPEKVSKEVKKTEVPTSNEQANLSVPIENTNTTFPEVVIEKTNEKDQVVAEEKTEEKVESKVTIAPLKQNIDKQENSYVSLNDKKDINQTAAAKTENTIVPKEEKKEVQEPAFFVAVEEMPELVGGIKGLQNKIVYPEIAKRVGVEGKVLVQAIVDENGKVISTSTIKGIGAGCDEVAMDAVRNSKFTPGKQRGKNVKVQVTIPIIFKK